VSVVTLVCLPAEGSTVPSQETNDPEGTMATLPGVHVATTTPFRADGSVDLDAYAAHCRWLVAQGVDGLVPCGSLGEYEVLTPEERRAVVEAAVRAAAGVVKVIPGVAAPSGPQARAWAEHAAAVGADGVMALPPLSHAATDEEVVAHYEQVAAAGLPVVVYNNPFSTRLDLRPALLARLAEIDGVVAVKEFSGDVRRVTAILQASDRLEVLCGADDVAFESALMGASGWIGGFTGVFPAATAWLFREGVAGRVTPARDLYRALLPLLRWDTTPRFVQAIKLAQDLVGQPGGAARPPRLPLAADAVAAITAAVARAQEAIAAAGVPEPVAP